MQWLHDLKIVIIHLKMSLWWLWSITDDNFLLQVSKSLIHISTRRLSSHTQHWMVWSTWGLLYCSSHNLLMMEYSCTMPSAGMDSKTSLQLSSKINIWSSDLTPDQVSSMSMSSPCYECYLRLKLDESIVNVISQNIYLSNFQNIL